MLGPPTWATLAKGVGVSDGVVALRLCPESAFNVFAAYEPATSKRVLLIRSARNDVRPSRPLPAGRGFRVQFVVNSTDPNSTNSLHFELLDSTHADVFDVIGNNVLSQVLASADDKEAFDAFVAQIQEWQRFLDALPGEALSQQARQGLLAELWFMLEFLLREQTASIAVGSWAGPKAQAKDFQFNGLAVEVKSSAAKEHSRFGVSNELQLDAETVGRLLLCGVLLEPLTAGGISLPETIATIRTSLAGDRAVFREFSDKLLQSGYRDIDAQHYVERYAVRSVGLFDVRADFPRIVASDLRQGVGDVRYSILLSECERFRLAEDAARLLIQQALL
jgi:hypothetical protein